LLNVLERRKDPLADVVEQTGVWFSSMGVPRAAGQMFGYLLACDPDEQSAAEIAERTGMSRASVSSSARLLQSMNAVEERHRVGDRKTYYRMRRDWWIEMATAKISGFEQLADLARRTRAAGGLPRTDGLDELIEFSEFWATEIPKLAERWYRRRDEKEEA
jgi:DNA-binding transcriptional regulator GbsR (MarR family)